MRSILSNSLHRSMPPAAGDSDANVPKLASHALMGGRREVVIVHGEREYRLRVTQNGKLILTA